MGELNVLPVVKTTDLRDYTQLLFKDVEALEQIISQGMIEEGVQRIGVEQELCLINKYVAPAPFVEELLAIIDDPHFTTELAKFNLEINLDPIYLSGQCFSNLDKELRRLLDICEKAGSQLDCYPLLTGILPTIRSKDLGLDSMTQRQRYRALNEAILDMRKTPQVFYIQGTDELSTRSESVMFESCNTSFQIHFQVGVSNFISSYNWAQAIAGPVLAACTNAPIFLGKRLWHETRIALFQQATDTRGYQEELRKTRPRVTFGDAWLRKDIVDIIKEDLSTYRPLVLANELPNSMEQLSDGQLPMLKALSMFNGTIYRWNRPCYGITDGVPHLRIESRYLPSGPSVLDEIANTIFWVGLMNGMQPEHQRISQHMEFHEIKTNFIKSARHGLGARLEWMGKEYDARELIIDQLIPLAKEGLGKAQIASADQEKYLGVLQERTQSAKTGATWILNSFNSLTRTIPENTALAGITEAMRKRQQQNLPVHLWEIANQQEIGDGPHRYQRIDQIMSKKLFTVYEEDLIDLVPNIMKWNRVRHMLVENRQGELVGLITLGRLGKYYAENKDKAPVNVKEVMVDKVITISCDTKTLEAIRLMQKHNIGCLPVLNQDQKLVGVVTEKDLLPVAASYLRH